jgi:NADH-quinone oxidoreductase subunit E
MSSTSPVARKERARETSAESTIESIVEERRGRPGALLGILEEVQNLDEHRHLSEANLRSIAASLDLPLSQVYSVATFYSFFNLKPQGLHSVVVCRGTACHTRGSLELLEEAVDRLGIEAFREEEENSATTLDGFASVRTVACFGQCALAPVVEIDGEMMSRMTVGRLVSTLQRLRKGGHK